jgi:hypothetical protein
MNKRQAKKIAQRMAAAAIVACVDRGDYIDYADQQHPDLSDDDLQRVADAMNEIAEALEARSFSATQ